MDEILVGCCSYYPVMVADFYAELRLVTCMCVWVVLYLVTKSPSTGK